MTNADVGSAGGVFPFFRSPEEGIVLKYDRSRSVSWDGELVREPLFEPLFIAAHPPAKVGTTSS